MKLRKKSYCSNKQIFINGVIYSIDKKSSVYEAMAIKDGIIVALATNDEIIKSCTNDTEIIDLKSRTVLPGFIDAHSHIPEQFMIKKDELSLWEAKNLKECLDLIQSYIDSHPNEEVIYGIGWKNSIFQTKYSNNSIGIFRGPSKKWLEGIITDKPIVLKSCDGNMLWLNDRAFKYFKITKESKILTGGKIELDEYGEVWGTLKGNAASILNTGIIKKMKNYNEEEYLISFIKYQNILHSYGITSIGSINQETIEFPLEIYKRLEIESKLKLRIVYGATIKPYKVCKKNINEQMHELKRDKVMYGTGLLNISIAKFYADGVIENMTAYLFKPYKLLKERFYANNGIFLWDEDELKNGIKMASRLDFNVCIHASGDFACKIAIDGIEYSLKNNINNSCRNTLINMDLITRYYIRRMKILNINAIIKPFWFYKDISSSKNEVVAIGEERAYRQYPVKSLINEGIIIAGGSDSDIIENSSPLKAIECATLRNLYDYVPSGYPKIVNMTDTRYRLNPRERVSIVEAIKMFTINAAYVLGKEKEIGSLEIGKKADFIILDKDIFFANPLDIQNINIDRTYFNGELVYLNE